LPLTWAPVAVAQKARSRPQTTTRSGTSI
jgi:hypothetical protein